jgi:hypothetical protein
VTNVSVDEPAQDRNRQARLLSPQAPPVRAGELSLFWTARHYTILCFRHNLSRQIAINSGKPQIAALAPASTVRDSDYLSWRADHIFNPRGGCRDSSEAHPKNPNDHQESGRAAVNNLMDAAVALRIPAITVASGPMTVKIRRRRLLSVHPGPQRRRIADRFHRGETAQARCHERASCMSQPDGSESR